MNTKRLKVFRNATPDSTFFANCAIEPDLIAMDVLDDRGADGLIPGRQYDWFVDFAQQWTRYLHANNRKWRSFLEDNERDMLYGFMCEWADSFLDDPDKFMDRFSMSRIA